jgi:hypothetical protein
MYSRVRIVDLRISSTATRPPFFLGISRCETKYRNDAARRVRTVCWSAASNVPTMRSTVFDASIVWSVENTRCPVSAASARSRWFPRSRISPTRITLGAWRSAAAERECKRRACRCAAHADAPSPSCGGGRNSIGSSIVRISSARVSLIRSMTAARVEDFPDPGGTGHQDDAVLQRGGVGEARRAD